MTPQFPNAVERWPLERLIPHARNARNHSEGQALAERGYDAEQVDADIAADKARETSLGLSFGSAAVETEMVPAADASSTASDAAAG